MGRVSSYPGHSTMASSDACSLAVSLSVASNHGARVPINSTPISWSNDVTILVTDWRMA